MYIHLSVTNSVPCAVLLYISVSLLPTQFLACAVPCLYISLSVTYSVYCMRSSLYVYLSLHLLPTHLEPLVILSNRRKREGQTICVFYQIVATLWVVKWKRRLNNWNILWSFPLYVFIQSFVSSHLCFRYFSNYPFLRPSEVIFSSMIRNEVLVLRLHRTTFKTVVPFTWHELLHRRFPRPIGCRPLTFGNMPIYFSTNTLAGGRFFTFA
jgi:hypothetical protein